MAHDDKSSLRRALLARRSAIPAEELERASAHICEAVLDMPAVRGARVLTAFAALPGEVDLEPAARRAGARGQSVALPITGPRGTPLSFRWWIHEGVTWPLEVGRFGVRTPVADAPVVPLELLDCLLVPALAIDPWGTRLGFGAGYYDRTLALCPAAATVGIVLHRFLSESELPSKENDVPVQWITTEHGTGPARSR